MTTGLLAERGHLNTWLGRDHSFPGEAIKTSLKSGLDISWLTYMPGNREDWFTVYIMEIITLFS